jgi:cytochrome P450
MSWLSTWLESANPQGSRQWELPVVSDRSGIYASWLQVGLGLLRMLWPIPCLFGWALVTRKDDVEEALARSDVFGVPFAAEMARLNDGASPGTPFILGIDDPAAHAAQLAQVMAAFRQTDIETRVAGLSNANASAIVHAANGGPFDAIGGLVARIPLDICTAYYGVPIPDRRDFVLASEDVSGHLFGLPPIQPDAAVDVAATKIRAVVDAAILNPMGGNTVIARLGAPPLALPPNQIRAFMMGMIEGFVPTNIMAAGNILDMLLTHPEFLAAARAAALAGDDDLLAHCLFEALRFQPINFGPFRTCNRDFILAAGTRHATRIPQGTKVLVSTTSAMFDCAAVKRPFRFVPGRPASDLMHFGFGMHWCVGALIARAQITQMFKPLLLKADLRRAPGSFGTMQRHGGFPDRLDVVFTP